MKNCSEENRRKKRNPKHTIVISGEGNYKTERAYLSHFDDRNNSYYLRFANGDDTDPVGIVKLSIKEIQRKNLDLENGDKAYCIFDLDSDPKRKNLIEEAMKLAKENGIEVIVSSPSFELWYLLHYEFVASSMTNAQLLRRLKKHITKYQKGEDYYLELLPKMGDAIGNAKKLEKTQKENGKALGTMEANPSTDFYKLVEYLRKK